MLRSEKKFDSYGHKVHLANNIYRSRYERNEFLPYFKFLTTSIEISDITKLPNCIQIDRDNVTYWIYILADNPKCFTCKKDNNLAKQCPNVTITTEYSLPVKSEDISYEETVAIVDTLEVAEFDVDIHGEDDKSPLSNTESCSTNMKTSCNLYLSSDDSDTKVNHE